jgi:hypothetical protein
MHNVEYKVAGGKLVITVDVGASSISAAPASKTGKTNLLATTGGAVTLPHSGGKAMTFALNVMVKP